jgi:hypothetical protein
VQDGYAKRFFSWLIGSTAAHAALFTALSGATPRNPATWDEYDKPLWLEPASQFPASAAPEPQQLLPQAQPKTQAQPQPEPQSAARKRVDGIRMGPVVPPLPAVREPALDQPPTTASDASGTLAVDGSPTAASDSDALDLPPSAASDTTPDSAPARPALPPQLSLWLAPIELQRLVIVRSPSALLAALPGYRDILRGSDINPFDQLRALRVFLPGLSAERLMLAGVHSGGEAELMQAAERIARSRERVPSWRGSSQLRAAAWLDGSGFDRGLAVHGDAFAIGARRELPQLLGRDARVAALSKTKRGVLVVAALHDVAHYLPALRPCQLRSLRISISEALRLQLQAEYESAPDTARAATCLTSLGDATIPLRATRELLARATAGVGSTHSQLRTEVTRDEIAKLLDEICWSLRRLARA